MAELEYLPIATAALIADTTHMSAEQFGAYVRLLIAMWRNGARLADDQDELAAIVGMDRREWNRIAVVVLRPMTIAGGVVTQKRLTETWQRVQRTRKMRAVAGSRGAKKRWPLKGGR